MRMRAMLLSVVLSVLFSATCYAQAVTVSLKLSDGASSKILKTPIGTFLETASKYNSKQTVVLNAPGVDPAAFNADSEFRLFITEVSGNTDYEFKFKLGEDPKYTPGAKSVKIAYKSIGGVVGKATLASVSLKFGKDTVTVNIQNKILPVFAVDFLNFSVRGADNLPEGKGTGTKTGRATVSFGTLSGSIESFTYTASYSNKSKDVNGQKLWQGSAKGKAEVK
jgi:hypothetical protein